MKKELDRRDFIKTSAGLGAAVMGAGAFSRPEKTGSVLSTVKTASRLVAVHGEDAFKNTIRAVEAFGGIEKTFAIQAGREIRIMVEQNKVSDENIVVLARDIAKKIEKELSYPGQIKVNVIRETRAVEYAK